MPSATSHHASSHHASSASLDHILHSLQQALHHHQDPASTLPQLSRAKLALLQHNALIPSDVVPAKTLVTARSILETGALLSIRARDPESFVRYYNQLQPFYDYSASSDTSHHYPASKERSKITGLYLLLLLSQGDYAGFHTVLEGLVMVEGRDTEVEEDEFIRYPVELERSLMEGSYDQVWRKTKGESVPGEEFALFSDILVNTIRLEIASCAQRSYPSLSISSAKNLLFLDSEGAVVEFAMQRGWTLGEGRIYFPGLEAEKDVSGHEGDQKEIISNMIGYARDLEMIV